MDRIATNVRPRLEESPDNAHARTAGISLASGYSSLPEHFFARLDPVPVHAPKLIEINRALAAELGLDLGGLDEERLAALFAGNWIPPGATPIAAAYAGHQFGYFVPQLGDGRAILLGEVRDRHGVLREIQLKGSGRTPFSRNGDGRAAMGPVLREYLVSEAMTALGIPATRALAAVATGESVYRETEIPGAVLTRVAASHVRVGTFQYFAARADVEATRRLADFVIERHYPEALTAERPAVALLRAVAERQARLISSWMQVGFIHGVMNTDNMAISGETIDFGPCAFMDAYDPAKVFSSIDSHGRYAYSNQVHAGGWNLARFAETLLPLIDPVADRAVELATEAIAVFAPRFAEHWLAGMRRKIGLASAEDRDSDLIETLLAAMHRVEADFTLTFRRLCDGIVADGLAEWAAAWRARLTRDPQVAEQRADAMRRVNPAYIPRNHRIEQVIAAATVEADYSPFRELLRVLQHPYEEQGGDEAYMNPPLPEERVLRTFCGT
jgi:protein adenylyltransferase